MSVVVGWLFRVGVWQGSSLSWRYAYLYGARIFVTAGGAAFRGRAVRWGRVGGRARA